MVPIALAIITTFTSPFRFSGAFANWYHAFIVTCSDSYFSWSQSQFIDSQFICCTAGYFYLCTPYLAGMVIHLTGPQVLEQGLWYLADYSLAILFRALELLLVVG